MPLSVIRVDIDNEKTRQNDLVTGIGGQNVDHLNTPIVIWQWLQIGYDSS